MKSCRQTHTRETAACNAHREQRGKLQRGMQHLGTQAERTFAERRRWLSLAARDGQVWGGGRVANVAQIGKQGMFLDVA